MKTIVFLTSLGLGCLACGTEPDPSAPPALAPTPQPQPKEEAPKVTPLRTFLKAGGLKESKEKISALVLPQGMTKLYSSGRTHYYRSPIKALLYFQYFQNKLQSADVKRLGTGGRFLNADIKDAGEHILTKVDVFVREGARGSETRIEIREIPPPTKRPRSK